MESNMNKIHEKLKQKLKWYKKWHERKYHSHVHYGILILLILSFFAFDNFTQGKTIAANTSNISKVKKYDPFADLQFSKRMKGKKDLGGLEAINALGKDIDKVAKNYKLTKEQLQHGFKKDKSLRINKDALLFFADVDLTTQNASPGDGTLVSNLKITDISDSQTFILHSRPQSSAKIYLDFDGETVQSPYWNNGTVINALPYSQDTDPSFSSAELNAIKAIWRSVSEDYSAYDVDVTTERPTNYNQYKYTHVIITPTSSWFGSAGGVSYISSFNWGLDVPAWVFSQLLNNNTKAISEAAAHEVGHSLNLYHASGYDSSCSFLTEYYSGLGTAPGWAPIMGNSYSRGLTQFINTADYPQIGTSFGCNAEENEPFIISQMIPFINDDAGNSISTAVYVTKTASGTIATIDHTGTLNPNDVDVYRFDAQGGNILISVSPMNPVGTILLGDADFKVRLLDMNGNVLAESDPSYIGTVNFTLTSAPAGTYYIEISPIGNPSVGYTSSGSMGKYYITGSYSLSDSNLDTTPPTGIVTNPLNGSTVSGVVLLTADASDNTGIKNVEFYRDSVFIGSDNSYPYSLPWDTSNTPNGKYGISVKVYDNANNIASSPVNIVTINNVSTQTTDTTPPTVKIVVNNGTNYISSKNSSITIKGSASDENGVVKMEVVVDGNVVSTTKSTSISYKMNTKNLSIGTHDISIRAYDPSNNIGTSASTLTKNK